MTLPTYVLGLDPGPTPGIATLSATAGRVQAIHLYQCSWPAAASLIGWLLAGAQPVEHLVVAVERFVVGPRAARSSTPEAGRVTRDLIGAVTAVAQVHGATVVQRSASEVKPWATDRRLARAGLVVARGMPHAVDAAQHALFAAVHAGFLPDPLSATAPRGDL